jgi:hypothetical protein
MPEDSIIIINFGGLYLLVTYPCYPPCNFTSVAITFGARLRIAMDLSLIVIEQIRVKLYDKGPSQPPSLASPATSRDVLQPPPLCHDSDTNVVPYRRNLVSLELRLESAFLITIATSWLVASTSKEKMNVINHYKHITVRYLYCATRLSFGICCLKLL